MESKIDWKLFYRLDQGVLIDLISSAARVFHQHSLVSQTEMDDLRVSIGSCQQLGLQNASESLAASLDKDKNSFLRILKQRYGTVGFSLTLARCSLRPILEDLQKTLAEMGLELLAKSQLMFNRTINIHQGKTFQRQVLYSALIVDIGHVLAEVNLDFEQLATLISSMLPADINPYCERDGTFDQELARAIGLEGVNDESTPFSTERKIHQIMSLGILKLVNQIEAFVEVCENSPFFAVKPAIKPACAWLQAEAFRLGALSFPDTEEFEAWDLRRQNFNSALAIVNQTLRNLHIDLLGSINVTGPAEATREYMSGATSRAVVMELLERGVRISDAEKAGEDLRSYCATNRVEPCLILPEEFFHIHPLLNRDCCAQRSSDSDGRATAFRYSPSKTKISKDISLLSHKFHQVLAGGLMTILMCFLGVSCGFKTNPKSYEPDIRPQLPLRVSKYRGQAYPNKAKSKKPQKAEQSQEVKMSPPSP